jgi:hypothetical protein
VLTIAAAMSFRSPFISPMDKRAEADAKKQAMVEGLHSDHLTLLKVIDANMRLVCALGH